MSLQLKKTYIPVDFSLPYIDMESGTYCILGGAGSGESYTFFTQAKDSVWCTVAIQHPS